MKKIFILTGESSGDKLASKVISDLKKINSNIDYLSVGGENLKALGIKSIYDIKEITYLGFTNVILNLFKINKKITAGGKVISIIFVLHNTPIQKNYKYKNKVFRFFRSVYVHLKTDKLDYLQVQQQIKKKLVFSLR